MKRAGLTTGVTSFLVMAGLLFVAPGADARNHKHSHHHSHHPVHGSYDRHPYRHHDQQKGQPRFAAKPPRHAQARPRSRTVVQQHHYHYHLGVPTTRGPVTAHSRRYDPHPHHWDKGLRVLSETLHLKRR